MTKKMLFIIFVITTLIFSLSSCVNTSESTVTKVINNVNENTFKAMNFIIENNYGDKITQLKFEKNEVKGTSTLSFDLKKAIHVTNAVETIYKDGNTVWIRELTIKTSIDDELLNDAFIVAVGFLDNEDYKKEINDSISKCRETPNSNIKINIGTDSFASISDNILTLVIREST